MWSKLERKFIIFIIDFNYSCIVTKVYRENESCIDNVNSFTLTFDKNLTFVCLVRTQIYKSIYVCVINFVSRN